MKLYPMAELPAGIPTPSCFPRKRGRGWNVKTNWGKCSGCRSALLVRGWKLSAVCCGLLLAVGLFLVQFSNDLVVQLLERLVTEPLLHPCNVLFRKVTVG